MICPGLGSPVWPKKGKVNALLLDLGLAKDFTSHQHKSEQLRVSCAVFSEITFKILSHKYKGWLSCVRLKFPLLRVSSSCSPPAQMNCTSVMFNEPNSPLSYDGEALNLF